MCGSRGRVMRYGSCNSQPPALLAGGVVAGAQGCLLVALARFPDTSSPLHLAAPGRAVTLPTVAAGADDHQPAAPRAIEHPVALLDGQASCHRELDAEATAGDTQPWCGVIALAVTQKPRLLRQQSGLVFSVEALFYRPDRRLATRPSLTPAIRDSAVCSVFGLLSAATKPKTKTTSTACAWGNQIQQKTRSTRLRRRRKPDPALTREENQNHYNT